MNNQFQFDTYLHVNVTATYHKGRKGDYYNPPEPDYCEIDSVECDGKELVVSESTLRDLEDIAMQEDRS